MRSRRLTLRSETLSALTTDDLANVAGAAAPPTTPVLECWVTPLTPAISKSVVPCYTSPCTS